MLGEKGEREGKRKRGKRRREKMHFRKGKKIRSKLIHVSKELAVRQK